MKVWNSARRTGVADVVFPIGLTASAVVPLPMLLFADRVALPE
ncbi:hypothetical protein [Frankia sp. QA3]|nr:hypothetical protein [Frankia sp. QA3]EIV91211.1 hypothetical protein FraQA3DRAFT_0645 [Frankia sp. QA3]